MVPQNERIVAQARIEDVRISGHRELDLSGLGWQEVPESISQLSSLRALRLADNQLTTLPSYLLALADLRELYLDENQLTELPEFLAHLSELECLTVRSNQLMRLPESLGRLTHLRRLDMSDNQLSVLPDSLGNLELLQSLNLEGNRLTQLPDSLNALTNLKELYLHNNDILRIPTEILGPSSQEVAQRRLDGAEPATILQYLFAKVRVTSRPLCEAKILVLGDGGAGKTSLIRRLQNNAYDEHGNVTHGITIKTWSVPVRHDIADIDASAIRLDVWDFGGQEIMHATHQFFFSERALYLLVLDAHRAFERNRLDYWMRLVQIYGSMAPVIVAISKSDLGYAEIDTHGLRRRYPNIQGFLWVSSLDGSGITALQNAIEHQINQLPHVFDEIPGEFFSVKYALEKMAATQEIMTIEAYRLLCLTHDIHDGPTQDLLLGFLHDLGRVLHFADAAPVDSFNDIIVSSTRLGLQRGFISSSATIT